MKWLTLRPEFVTTLPVVGQAHPLRFQYRRFLVLSAILAASLHLTAVTGWVVRRGGESVEPLVDLIDVRLVDIVPPPSLVPKLVQNPLVEIARQVAPPPIGIPDPVKDHMTINRTIADMTEISAELDPVNAATLAGSEAGPIRIIVPPAKREADQSPGAFIAVEQKPVLISMPPPVYPEIARQAEVEGTVLLRVLVGKDGRVREAIVVEGIPMLNAAAIDAARGAIFKPALQQYKPVAVWVEIPMQFLLN